MVEGVGEVYVGSSLAGYTLRVLALDKYCKPIMEGNPTAYHAFWIKHNEENVNRKSRKYTFRSTAWI